MDQPIYLQLIGMDLNKQRLKNRLNVKFEPLKKLPGSLKSLHRNDKITKQLSKEKQKDSSILSLNKNRSTSQIRLPSLQHKTVATKLAVQEKMDQSINLKEMRKKIKSIKPMPTIKVESRQPINQTLTFLIKNQILNIPKIVGMLQKARSDQFMYMKVKGIYQYQVCTENEKGTNYITVSKNGMVSQGELVPLERLIYEWDIYSNLKKIPFYRYFWIIKLMNKWNRGSKVAKFVQTKYKIKKLLYLENDKILSWKNQLRNILFINDLGGSMGGGWVERVAKEILINKGVVEQKLLIMSIELLQKFKLPLSANFQLMNKVLNNLINLNLTFETKLRIERELEIIYKMGRMLQLHQLQSIVFYLINHLEKLNGSFIQSHQNYLDTILQPLEGLDINKPTYIADKQKILLNATVKDGVNFKVYIDQDEQIAVEPAMTDIFKGLRNAINQFIDKIDKFDYKIIRVQKFNYIVKNVIKPHQIDELNNAKDASLKQYIKSIDMFFDRRQDLKNTIEEVNTTIKRKFILLEPFYNLYKEYKQKVQEKVYQTYNYDNMSAQIEQIDQAINFCQTKLHDGQYFVMGYLSHLDFKEQIINYLEDYKSTLMATIPVKVRTQKSQFYSNVLNHLNVFRLVVKDSQIYIKVHQEFEQMEDKMLVYASDLTEIERLADLYLRIKKVQLGSLVQQRNLLNELKIKVKNFKETKQNSYLIYRKQVQTRQTQLLQKVDSINPEDHYYQTSQTPSLIYNKCHHSNQELNRIHAELKHINQLESFFNMKTTEIPKLSSLLVKFQVLEEIWSIYKEYEADLAKISPLKIMKVEPATLIRKFQIAIRKMERYKKDPDHVVVSQYLLEKMPKTLSSIYLVDDLQNQSLRQRDYKQIGQIFEKEYKIDRQVKQTIFSSILQNKVYQLRPQILELILKSQKEQQIERLLQQFQLWWKTIRLQGDYLDQYPLIIIFNANDHIRTQIQQYTTTLLNIINHKYGTVARKECNRHLRNITALADLLSLAINHQEKFLALFPILTSKYAEKQLPNQSKKFVSIIEKTMKNVRWLIKPTQNLNQTTRHMLNNHIKQFDALSKYLSVFLEKKRVKFQRFYFLQDDELLEVLVGIGADKTIFRMFEGVKGWLIGEDGYIKEGVEGVGGEKLRLKGWSYKNAEPEIIFKSLQDAIRSNLNSIVRTILHSYEFDLKDLTPLYQDMPWMCIYTVELILFTKQIQINVFQNKVDLSLQASLIQQNISTHMSQPHKYSNYITLQLFLLHFVQQLKRDDVYSVFDFKWHSFLRYYYQNQGVIMKTLGSEHGWGGQYQGLWTLMINTSDIRRAHVSILSNIKYGNGVLLQGPSGTGKTQSLKELGRCMAKYCVIFNCSSQVNIRTLQKLLSGLCYTGSWICLDQINRLIAQIMSVVANQINSIKNAVVQSKQIFNFMGKDMKLRPGVGIFSTMNPIYLKRAKLTQNLKSYFRIISVNVPDYQKILEVMLYSSGIGSSSVYSQKISKLFKNLSIQLMQRQQYDFGLRAMKFFIYNLTKIRMTIKNEEQSIVEALYKTFYSRLDEDDKQVFLKVLHDTLGKKKSPKQSNYKVNIMKQAPQTGIIVLGPTSSKTTIINQYINLFNKVNLVVEVFNPNSVELKYFLGENIMGRWQQGVVQRLARASFQNSNTNYVLVLDSKLKSQTIQNFNTLLDDSKLLSLANGTRLKIQDNFKIVMQTPDLHQTSPATITRCNVIHITEHDVSKFDLLTKMLPQLAFKEMQTKFHTLLSLLTPEEIRRILKLTNLLYYRRFDSAQNLTQSESIGYEKCLMYSLQLLQFQGRVKEHINRDNALPSKKNPFNYFINFSRYKQGEFVQFDSPVHTIKKLQRIFIPTVRQQFYEYILKNAIEKKQNVLWKGQPFSGKSTSILTAIEQIYNSKPEQKNMLKLTIHPSTTSTKIIQFIQQKTLIKDPPDVDHKCVLFYVDDINMTNDQTKECLRYIVQYEKIFSLKNKSVHHLPKHILIADANNEQNKQFTARFCRHFVQINMEDVDWNTTRFIFTKLIKNVIAKTKTSQQFKAGYDLQLDKLVQFMLEYIQINNKNYRQAKMEGTADKLQLFKLTYCNFIKIINNMKMLTQHTCRQYNDLLLYVMSQMRIQQVQHRKSTRQLDYIKLAWSEVFKQKHKEEYIKVLKSQTGHPSDCLHYTKYNRSQVEKIDKWEELRQKIVNQLQEKYYISEFVLLEIIRVLRVVEWHGGHYCLAGDPGVGKKTILKISLFLSGKEAVEILPAQDQKKIQEWYFALIKEAFQKQMQHIILMEIKDPANDKILNYLEQINSQYPIQALLSSQYEDYAYSNSQSYEEVQYQRFTKPFAQVIEDFMHLAKRNIQILFLSTPEQLPQFVKHYHYLHKQTTYRWVNQFPSQAILQISNQILDQSLPEVDKPRLNTILLKIYNDLSNLMKVNLENNEYHFKYNSFYHFNLIKKFIQNYKLVIDKAKEKEDILNRSILKVYQISQTLQTLKEQIKNMEPQIKQKTQKLQSVVPVLEQKKRASEEVRSFVLAQKRQIEAKNAEIQETVRQVQQKIKISEPLMQEANDSMLTIKRGQLSQLRNNPNPHPLIKFTVENLSILLGEGDSQQSFKKVLSDPNLLSKLKNINPTFTNVQKVQKRSHDNIEWTFDNVAKISYGIRYMVRWTNSIIKFYIMKNDLSIQKNKVEQYKREIGFLEEKLHKKQQELNSKQYEFKLIEDEYNNNKRQLINLQELMTLNNKKYQNAGLIKQHLEEQMVNWHQNLQKQKVLRNNVVPTSVMITLFLQIYCTLHSEQEQKIDAQIKQLFIKTLMDFDPNFKVIDYVKDHIIRQKDQNEISQEKTSNHPLINLQKLSVQDSNNAKIIQTIYHLNKRPIFLDPDNQALNWLERQVAVDEDAGKMIVVKQSFLSSTKNVEMAFREGYILILLIEDELDQFTDDVLSAKITETSGNILVEYNKNKFYMNKNFRLILSNKSRNPNLSNKLYISHPILNFQITKSLLKNMLLKRLIQIQNKDTYNIRQELEISNKKNVEAITQIQEQIIQCLINSKKTLIDDQEFINILYENQRQRNKLKENQFESGVKNMTIKRIFDNYQNVSEQASRVFISLKLMSKINPLLTWNTQLFSQYFEKAALASISTPLFDQDEESEDIDLSISQRQPKNYDFDNYNIGLGNSRPTSALSYMSGLTGSKGASAAGEERKDDFEQEHPTSLHAFQNLIGLRQMIVDDKQKGTMSQQRQKKLLQHLFDYLKPAFTEQERILWGLTLCLMNYDLKEIKMLLQIKVRRKKLKDYLDAGQLSERIKHFLNINVEKTDEQLKRIFTELNPFHTLGQQLSQVDILTLGKLIVPNNFSRLCQILIKSKGYQHILNYSETATVNWFQRSDNIHPILLVMGEDPIYRISDYLSKRRYKNVILIPMGEGQNKLAEVVLQKESRKENLAIIHNLHISPNFMVFLAKMLQQFQIRPPHKNFRLMLISAKFDGLSQEITNYCHKYLIEQPMGIKNQIRYLRLQSTINFTHPNHKKLSFVLTYLHSIINNLSKYKPYGWNLKYEFHTSDYLHSLQMMKQIAENPLNIEKYMCNIDLEEEKGKLNVDDIDFKALKFMIGDVGYVGKLADDIDRLKMNILIDHFINPEIFKFRSQNQAIKHINFAMLDSGNNQKVIQEIHEQDSGIYGLHQSIKPVSESEQTILSSLAHAYLQKHENIQDKTKFYDKEIPVIDHKFEYINQEIANYNETIQKIKMNGPTQNLLQSLGNGLLLSNITNTSRVFNLKSFSNPRQFFISIIQDTAHRNHVVYEKVEIVWTLLPKENTLGVYGISNLKLEGACLNANKNGLEEGVEERDITLYIQAVVKKKQKENKKLVSIPLYLNEERQGQINSYGDNTNLLYRTYVEANHPQDFWILRSTAFIVV